MKLQDVILRGLSGARPAANSVPVGTLYYSTNTGVTERSNGATWDSYTDTGGGSGISQLTGDVTAGPGSGSQAAAIANNAVTTAKIADDQVTYAKIQDVSATDRLLGRDTAAAGDIEEIPVSAGLEFTGGPGLRTTVASRTRTIGITVDGGSTVITTGVKGYRSFPVAGTITGVRVLANAAGNLVFDIKKSSYAGFPGSLASIVASAPPTLSAAQKSEDTTLTGWTTAVAAGDIFSFEITGTPATITRATLELTVVVS